MINVKFKEIKKRKVYKTWQHKNRKTGILTSIYYNPNGKYHWVICCFIKRCGLHKCTGDNCDKRIYYNSLEQGLEYESFDECLEALNQWYKGKG